MSSTTARQTQARLVKRTSPPRRAPVPADYLAFFVGIPLAVAFLFSLIGIRLTYQMPYLPTLGYLIVHMFIAWWAVSMGSYFTRYCFRSWRPPAVAVIVLGFFASMIPAAFLYQEIGDYYAQLYPVFAQNRSDDALPSWDLAYLVHFVRYSSPALALFLAGAFAYRYTTGVDWFGYQEDNAFSNDAETANTAERQIKATTAALIPGSKLDPNAEVLAVKAEQHYINIWSTQGTDLVRFKFSDLPATLAGCNGAQVHRSWWVNFDRVTAVEKAGRKLQLTVGDNLEVPVSLSYKNAVLGALEDS